jgi:SAM-dependent methyltransferase
VARIIIDHLYPALLKRAQRTKPRHKPRHTNHSPRGPRSNGDLHSTAKCPIELRGTKRCQGIRPRVVHQAIPEGASILELGAGAGRVTHPLLALGHPVVAVDESPEMLERIHGAKTMLGRIEDLDLGRGFDAVLFASYLVNVPDLDWRRTLLAACRRLVIDAYLTDDRTWVRARPVAGDHGSGGGERRIPDQANVSAAWLTTDHDLQLEDAEGFSRIVLRHLQPE